MNILGRALSIFIIKFAGIQEYASTIQPCLQDSTHFMQPVQSDGSTTA